MNQFPSQSKLANVIPLFKNDNRQLKVFKLCEKNVFVRLYDFLINVGYLYKFQSGFRPGDSTVNQLSYLVHQIYLALERKAGEKGSYFRHQ